jgi:hypothetical protein
MAARALFFDFGQHGEPCTPGSYVIAEQAGHL